MALPIPKLDIPTFTPEPLRTHGTPERSVPVSARSRIATAGKVSALTKVYEPTSDSDSDSDAENEHHVQQLRVPPLPLLLDGKCGLPAKPCPVARPTLNCVHEDSMLSSLANGAIAKLTVLAIFFSLANGWIPRLMNGRPKGGMLGAPMPTRNVKPPPEQWFDYQRLDHFDGSNVLLWKQRYFVNDEYFKPGGPIFLMIGGEGPANPIWMVEGAWVEYAKQYNAVCVMLEHRYYGKSHPVKDLSLKNLRYLSSRQALADLAYFIDYYRLMNDMKNNSLITFGGSYPGSLSAWFRSKYPYKVDGAVATSAPIFAKLAFYEYLEVVADSLDSVNPNCNTEIKNATQTMYQWVGQEEKRPILKQMFQLCDDINNTNILDLAGLFSNTAGNFEGVVQYNRDNRAFEGAVGTNITMDVLCDIMTDFTKGSAIERYAEVNSLMLKTYSEDCLDFTYKKLIEDMRKVDWASSAGEGGRQWMYQTCSEFGWFQGSESYKQPFGNWFFFPSNYSVDQCMDIYEKEFEEVIFNNVDDTNRYYGGYKLDVTKVVFPNGKVDPWHAMGVTQDLSPDATAIYIPGTAHCANMYPATPSDPPELIAARQTIAKLIGKWIS